ncbi:amino acid permease [Haliovirga abyssi]|uniref:Amino acid transporter n=1 Tax=Haliovirga abyssi TaxID=2996794 RepID=A0AAU9DEX3_9FUSO|nr:amino acid permease [Haliovirga abyssi]BDU49912.1 amino acid transporter [Haliovirga abyssi]
MLKKELGFWGIYSMALGAMISSGLFVLPGIAYREVGPMMISSYIVASIMMIPTLFSEAELSTAMPKAGGDYFFIDRSLGVFGGTIGGFANWFFISLKTSFAFVGIGAFYELINPNTNEFQMRLIAISFAVVFVIINLLSVKFVGKIEVFLVFWLILILLIFIVKGVNIVEINNFKINRAINFFDIISTAGLVFISFGGITKITSVAEEVKNPTRNIPLGMFWAFISATILYILSITITVGIMDPVKLAKSYAPLSEASKYFMGNIGEIVLSVGALLAFITTGNAGIMAASRFPIAMSRDSILPPYFSNISKKFGTPYIAIISTGLFIISVVLFLDIKSLAKAASTIMLLSFIFVNIAVIIMRESNLTSYRPKSKTKLYPYLQIVGILAYIYVIMEMGQESIAISLLVLGGAAIWYFVYVKDRAKRESALMYIVKRTTSKELITSSLDTELKDILFERDNIIEDRFDKLIKNMDVLDIEGKMEMLPFFEIVAKDMAEKCKISEEKMVDLLIKREEESPTVIKEGIAIPHLIIPGEKDFNMLVVRCKEGINFSLEKKKVNVVFVLAGTKDERNFHLKVLMNIAQIISNDIFLENFIKSRSKEELRNILLLSERKRG